MRVAVALSGGVDSLRTASLLQDAGHEVFGVYMRLPAAGDAPFQAARDETVRSLAARLSIPLHTIDLRGPFESLVVRPFLDAYLAGTTPNPCTLCNPRIKFGLLMAEALRLGAERFATGHYARVEPPRPDSPRFALLRGLDEGKDQSYFLYGLTQEQLSRTIFPLGDRFKPDVRRWAESAGFTGSVASESREICFIPSNNYREFLEERLGAETIGMEGSVVDETGRIMGRHRGIFAFTVGQRRGLGIASSAPYYVVDIEPASGTVRIGRVDALYRRELTVSGLNWVSIDPPSGPLRCEVRIRYKHRAAPAEAVPLGPDRVLVRFDEPQRAVTPGQAAVFYRGDTLLGGGVIERSSGD